MDNFIYPLPFQNTIMTIVNLWNPTLEMILGLFDADGSFQIKIYHGIQKNISFYVNVIFTQKSENTDVLQSVLNTLSANNSTISKRQMINKSGTKSTGSSISLAFSNQAGNQLLEAWKIKPPAAPTKRLDYLIAIILFEASKKDSVIVINSYFKNSNVQDKQVAEFALLWLRYQMYFAQKQMCQQTSIESHYKKMGGTQEKRNRGISLGKKLLTKIKQQISTSNEDLINSLTEDRLLGYMIGDGSFMIQTSFSPNTSFKVSFSWTLTDCKENLPLLNAIRDKLIREKVADFVGMVCYNNSYYRLRVGGIKNCKCLVDRWQNVSLPRERKNQFNCFCQALIIYTSKDFRNNADLMKKFIRLKWLMNPHTNYKKKGSFTEDFHKMSQELKVSNSL
jgi:LAGLIDADG endonuclease